MQQIRHGALILLLVACRSHPVTEVLTARDVATISAATGAVSHDLLPDAGSPQVQLGPDEEFTPPGLHHSNVAPLYPPALVPLRLAPHTVVLRVTFDERGRAMTVERSPVGTPTDGEHRVAFETAAREALSEWRCSPPRIRRFRPGPDADGDGKPDFRIMTGQRFLKTYFDVSFTFKVVDGVPVVNDRPARPPRPLQ
ncbi:MAG TPA: hypothetical protein VMN39_03830 [Longimicrobiaceae bacterium]|nr:hypothetical protein [Longimicrobiaceae bacterium]